jgi:membrane protein DedA with SNARE-associated domain
MVIAGLHEVIAGIALIIAGLFVGYDGPSSMIWGAVLILLGVLLLVFWSVGLP